MRRFMFVLSYCFLAACGFGFVGAILSFGYIYFSPHYDEGVLIFPALGVLIGVLYGLFAGVSFKF